MQRAPAGFPQVCNKEAGKAELRCHRARERGQAASPVEQEANDAAASRTLQGPDSCDINSSRPVVPTLPTFGYRKLGSGFPPSTQEDPQIRPHRKINFTREALSLRFRRTWTRAACIALLRVAALSAVYPRVRALLGAAGKMGNCCGCMPRPCVFVFSPKWMLILFTVVNILNFVDRGALA